MVSHRYEISAVSLEKCQVQDLFCFTEFLTFLGYELYSLAKDALSQLFVYFCNFGSSMIVNKQLTNY